jgi:hypothetical protein
MEYFGVDVGQKNSIIIIFVDSMKWFILLIPFTNPSIKKDHNYYLYIYYLYTL